MEDLLQNLLAEEAELQFASFDAAAAWRLGRRLVELGMAEALPIAVQIRRGAQLAFHAGLAGASADNDAWLERKARLVARFGHSSFYLGRLLKSKGKSIEEAWLIPEADYAPHGGCFPIVVKGTGLVGSVAVSGLAQEDDHALVVRAVRAHLAEER
jgi:uncharacterized protein (UPF0303 family)